MANIFIDFESGDDNYGGTSFALLASGTDGRITSSTFSSATANFPNDGSLIGQYLSIFNGTTYLIYNITAWISSTSLTIAALTGGSALGNQSVDRQYYIGGRLKTFANVNALAPNKISTGDNIRIKASPTPTSLGINTTWTSSVLPSAINISSSTNATPIAVTTSSNHGYSTGNTVVITGHTTNTNANGTWEITVTGTTTFTLNGSTGNGVGGATGSVRLINNRVVRLASSLTQNIASNGNVGEGRTAWTATGAGNVTTALNTTDFKEGNCSDSIDIAAGFSTGLLAYKALGTTLDLSGYQQVSFWIKQTAGTVATSGDLTLRLCSDAAGVTAVDTFSIESPLVLNRWFPVTIDKGSALGSSIQSVALNLGADRGAQTFLICNIIACKASSSDDSLTLQSLIGKNTTNEPWCPIQSINGTRVIIDQNNNTIANSDARGYFGSSGTVTGFKRETIKTIMGTATTSTNALNLGNASNPSNLLIEAGYDRTNMSSVVDYTFFDGRNNFGRLINIVTLRPNITIKNFGMIRYSTGAFTSWGNVSPDNRSSYYNIHSYANTVGIQLDNNVLNSIIDGMTCYFDNCSISLFNGNSFNIIKNVYGGCGPTATSIGGGANDNGALRLNGTNDNDISNITLFNNTNAIYCLNTMNTIIRDSTFSNNNYGILNVSYVDGEIKNCTFSNNSIGSLRIAGNLSRPIFRNCTLSDTVEYDYNVSTYSNTVIFSQNHDNTADYHLITYTQGVISSVTDIRYVNSGIAWRFAPTSRIASYYPLVLELAKVAVSANSLVTVTAWMRRNNTGLNLGLRVKGSQIAGVSNEITSFMSAAINTWQQVTLTFTPTESGVVTIDGICTSGNTFFGYIDNITISQ